MAELYRSQEKVKAVIKVPRTNMRALTALLFLLLVMMESTEGVEDRCPRPDEIAPCQCRTRGPSIQVRWGSLFHPSPPLLTLGLLLPFLRVMEGGPPVGNEGCPSDSGGATRVTTDTASSSRSTQEEREGWPAGAVRSIRLEDNGPGTRDYNSAASYFDLITHWTILTLTCLFQGPT